MLFQKSEQKGAGKRGESVEKRGKKKAYPEKLTNFDFKNVQVAVLPPRATVGKVNVTNKGE